VAVSENVLAGELRGEAHDSEIADLSAGERHLERLMAFQFKNDGSA
jgi:hypothetical protein